MVIISISMLTTIISLKLYHTKGSQARNMPQWMRTVFLHTLPRFLSLPPPPESPDIYESINDDVTSWIISQMPEINFIYKELKFISDRIRKRDLDTAYEKQWKYASLVLDRLVTKINSVFGCFK